MAIKDAFSKPFCVYVHLAGTEIIYVGSGTAARAFCGRRSIRWNRMAKRRKLTVEIVAWFTNRFDAYQLEGQMIDEHRPCCNFLGNPDFAKPIRGERIRCIETDVIYGDFGHVIDEFRTSIGKLARSLSHGTAIRGFHFEWTI